MRHIVSSTLRAGIWATSFLFGAGPVFAHAQGSPNNPLKPIQGGGQGFGTGGGGGAGGSLDYYVSPNGSDAAAGTDALHPLLTVQHALLDIEIARNHQLTPSATIHMAAGRYQLSQPISMSPMDSNITIVGAAGNQTFVTGGILVTNWSHFMGANVRRRFNLPSTGVIFSAPVPAANLGVMQRRGGQESGQTSLNLPAELFADGKPLSLPRYPATGFVSAKSVGQDGVTVTFNGQRRTATAQDGWVQGFWSTYYWQTWEPMTAAPDRSTLQVGQLATGGPLGPVTSAGRFAIYNCPEDMSGPGEYWIDRDADRVYYWPSPSTGTSSIELSQLDGYLLEAYQVSNVSLQNIVFQSSRGRGVQLWGCTGSGLNNCVVRDTQLEGVYLTAGSGNYVRNSVIHDTGSVGVLDIEGDYTTLTPGGDVIDNNVFYDAGRVEQTYRPAVWVRGDGNVVSNNTISNCYDQGIIVDGCRQQITGNDVSKTCTIVNDAGAIYADLNQTNRGNVVSMNIIHDVTPNVFPPGKNPSIVGVYLDDFESGWTIKSNIFYNVDIGIVIGGGRSNTLYSNAFDTVTSPVWIDARGKSWATAYWAAGGTYQQQIDAMTQPEMSLFLSTFADFYDVTHAPDPALPQNNVVSYPYFPNTSTGILYLDPQYTVALLEIDNPFYNGNAMFTDPGHGNFTLVQGSGVTTPLPTAAGSTVSPNGT